MVTQPSTRKARVLLRAAACAMLVPLSATACNSANPQPTGEAAPSSLSATASLPVQISDADLTSAQSRAELVTVSSLRGLTVGAALSKLGIPERVPSSIDPEPTLTPVPSRQGEVNTSRGQWDKLTVTAASVNGRRIFFGVMPTAAVDADSALRRSLSTNYDTTNPDSNFWEKPGYELYTVNNQQLYSFVSATLGPNAGSPAVAIAVRKQ